METGQGDARRAIVQAVQAEFSANVVQCSPAGTGGTATVYGVTLDRGPGRIAVKISSNPELLKEEYEAICFLNKHGDFKLPKLYFLHLGEGEAPIHLLGMQYFDGISAENRKLLWKSKKKKARFVRDVAENLERLQSVTGEKYGPSVSGGYDDWHAYYRPLATRVLSAAEQAFAEGNFRRDVLETMRKAYRAYDEVFCEPIGKPTLIHGDYWTPNMIVDESTMELIGVVDPFHVMFADPEYEYFAMEAGMGKKFRLYEYYKKKKQLSDRCDLKNEFYALFSEVLWFTRTGHKLDSFLKYKAKLLEKQMKRFGIR